jgi:hypothetical protein
MKHHEEAIRRRRVGLHAPEELSRSKTLPLNRNSILETKEQFAFHRPKARLFALLCVGLLLYKTIFKPLLECSFGDGYSSRGGWIGALLDVILESLLPVDHRQSRHQTLDPPLQYPLVTERTRRRKLPGYSRFLEELLTRHHVDKAKVLVEEAAANNKSIYTRTLVTSIRLAASSKRQSSGVARNQSFTSLLKQTGCRPGWLCQRCLTSARCGTLQACKRFCAECYANHLCEPRPDAQIAAANTLDYIRLQVDRRQTPAPRVVPRIIHQEFREPVLALQYPELHRMQNSWRASGWEYRFYTPSRAKAFVERHFPNIVSGAYDALAVAELQSHLFRLLVLFVEGGVYANMDLLLETSLESLVRPEVGFMAARDDAFGRTRDHCLWNGFLVSQPGHPFVLRAIETAITAVVKGWTMDDLEAHICLDQTASIAKLRAATLDDIIVGSCGIGIAVHSALNMSTIDDFRQGLLPAAQHSLIGESSILMVSLYLAA